MADADDSPRTEMSEREFRQTEAYAQLERTRKDVRAQRRAEQRKRVGEVCALAVGEMLSVPGLLAVLLALAVMILWFWS